MLSALLRAGRSFTAGLSYLSTADSILMSYQKLPMARRAPGVVPADAAAQGRALAEPITLLLTRLFIDVSYRPKCLSLEGGDIPP